MRKYFIYAGLVAVGALAAATGSSILADNSSGKNHVTGSMNGFQENPSIVTTGKGTVDLRIDDEAQTIQFEIAWTDLEGGSATAAHIHIASRSFNGGVSAFFCGGGGKGLCPAGPDGSVTGTITAADVLGPVAQNVEAGAFAKLVEAIRAGHTYANVHNARWPGGEIRGQINNDSQRQFER